MKKTKMVFIMIACCAMVIVTAIFLLFAFPQKSELPVSIGIGPSPTLPKPVSALVPTIKIAKAIGWSKGAKPIAAVGLSVSAFARGLEHPRWVYVLPNGDTLVAESNAPGNSKSSDSITKWGRSVAMERAGAGVASSNRIILLRDTTGDGIADTRSVFLENLHSPFGMTLVGHDFYVANTDSVMRFPYRTGDRKITAPGVKLVDLTVGTLNHHWTKNLIASQDGSRLYASLGSNSNVAENGLEQEVGRAAIWEIDRATGKSHIFASGLRNPVGMAWQPQTGALWVVVNERDEIGNNLVPDYLTSVKEGAFYGWPFSYFGQHIDVRVKPQNPELVAKAIVPDYALGSHVAALGLTFYTGNLLPKQYHGGAFIGEHGSWNRNPPVGYKVVFVSFVNGKPSGLPKDILTGFLSPKGEAFGRPVGVAVDRAGALLVADDVGNTVWRVVPSTKTH